MIKKPIKKAKRNLSGLKGATWNDQRKKWRARLGNKGKYLHLGYFDTPELAHEAYLNALEALKKPGGKKWLLTLNSLKLYTLTNKVRG